MFPRTSMHCSVLVALLLPSPWIMTPANGLVAPLLRPIGMYPLAPLSPFRISLNYTFSGGDSAKTASSIQDEYDDSIILFARGDGNGPKTASPTSAITITEPTGKSSTSATTSVQSSVFSSLPTSSSTQPSVSKNKSTSSSKSKKRVTHRATSTTGSRTDTSSPTSKSTTSGKKTQQRSATSSSWKWPGTVTPNPHGTGTTLVFSPTATGILSSAASTSTVSSLYLVLLCFTANIIALIQ